MSVSSFRDLRVWQMAMDFAVAVYRLTDDVPRHDLYGLTSQLRRAAVSVPSNIAEGHAREHLKEYIHHVSLARGSLAEAETQLELALRLGYVSEDVLAERLDDVRRIGKQLYALRNALAVKASVPIAERQHPLTHDP